MRLEELTAGLSLTFMVKIGEEFISLNSKIQEVYPKKHCLLADAIFHENKVLSFQGKHIQVHMIATFPDEKPQLFEHVHITSLRKPNNRICYHITASCEGKPYNRREHFRCFVGVPAVVQFGAEKPVDDGMLKDVSISGFAVTCNKKADIGNHSLIHVLLEDYIEELTEGFSFNLYGIVVRSQELENGKTVYGCRLNHPVNGLNSYIMKKERVRLKKSNGGNL